MFWPLLFNPFNEPFEAPHNILLLASGSAEVPSVLHPCSTAEFVLSEVAMLVTLAHTKTLHDRLALSLGDS